MGRVLKSMGLIAVALALAASPALAGKYRTSPEEGRKYATKHMKFYLGAESQTYTLRGCWRIGPDGVGFTTYGGLYPGGVVCRFSGPIIKTAFDEDACRIFDFAAKQQQQPQKKKQKKKKKKRLVVVTDNVTKYTTDRPYWIGAAWCGLEPGAEGPPPPPGVIGPPLFG